MDVNSKPPKSVVKTEGLEASSKKSAGGDLVGEYGLSAKQQRTSNRGTQSEQYQMKEVQIQNLERPHTN